MIYRNSVVSPQGYLYNLIIIEYLSELYSPSEPPFLHDGEGIVVIYQDVIIDAYGPDTSITSYSSWVKTLGYQVLSDSSYGYFTWTADEPIHINHASPYILIDSTNGELATEGYIVTKWHNPQPGDVSPFQGTDIATVQSTASTSVVVRGGDKYFYNCHNLRQVTMHNAGWFGVSCFENCTSLSEMYLAKSPIQIGTDCFKNAGVVRGHIYAEGRATTGAGYTVADIPSGLDTKAWVVVNADNSRVSKYWNVDFSGSLTSTPTPAFTTMGDYTLALYNQHYSVLVTGFPAGQSLIGWHYYDVSGREFTIQDNSNPKDMLFVDDCWLEPVTGSGTAVQVNATITNGTAYALLEGNMLDLPAWIEPNTTLELVIYPDTHYRFNTWSDGDEHNPREITVTEEVTYSATCIPEQYTIDVSVENGTVAATVAGEPIQFPYTADYGTEVVATVTPLSTYTFSNWDDGSTDNPRTFTLYDDSRYTAYCYSGTVNYTLTATVSHGSVAAEVEGTAVQLPYTAPAGTTVLLTVTPDSGYLFGSWNDHNEENPRYVTLNSNLNLEATCVMEVYTIEGSALGGGGSVTLKVNGSEVPNPYEGPAGTVVTLVATADTGYSFTEWNDGDTTNPRSVTLTQDYYFDASFVQNEYTLTFNAINGVCRPNAFTGHYLDEVTVEAVPDGSGEFVQWNDGNTDNPRTFTVGTSSVTYTATCSVSSVTLTAVGENGNVIIRKDGVQVDNPYTAAVGTEVTLQMYPDDNYLFSHWDDGTTDNPRSYTMNSEARVVGVATEIQNYTVSEGYFVNCSIASVLVNGTTVTLPHTGPQTDVYRIRLNLVTGYHLEDDAWGFYNRVDVLQKGDDYIVFKPMHGDVNVYCTATLDADFRGLCITGVGTMEDVTEYKFTQVGNSTGWSNFETSYDAQTWWPYSLGQTNRVYGSQSVYVRGQKNSTAQSSDNYLHFSVVSGNGVALSGDLTSLLNQTGGVSDLSPYGNYTFTRLFAETTLVYTSPALPSTNLTTGCYYEMFQGSYVTTMPELPATNSADYCYQKMFQNCGRLIYTKPIQLLNTSQSCCAQMFEFCQALQAAPSIAATNMASCCYYEMFMNCVMLNTAPELYAEAVGLDSCYRMFYGCEYLYGPVTIHALTPIHAGSGTSAFNQAFSDEAGYYGGGTIYVGGNTDLWNEANCGIDSQFWDVELIESE